MFSDWKATCEAVKEEKLGSLISSRLIRYNMAPRNTSAEMEPEHSVIHNHARKGLGIYDKHQVLWRSFVLLQWLKTPGVSSAVKL